jgi:TRAP-type mannitol/chloroaromatic compound transport system permease large subunit
MENSEIGKYGRPFGVSFVITSLFSVLLLILKETNPKTVMVWMKAATTHHWITHTLLAVIIFVVLGVILANANSGQGIKIEPSKLNGFIVGAFIVSVILIAGFYLIIG